MSIPSMNRTNNAMEVTIIFEVALTPLMDCHQCLNALPQMTLTKEKLWMTIASNRPIYEEEKQLSLPIPRLQRLPLELGVVLQQKTHICPLQAITAVRMATIETRRAENWKARTIGIIKLAAGLLANNSLVRAAISNSTIISMSTESPLTLTTWIDLQDRRSKSGLTSIVSTTMTKKLMVWGGQRKLINPITRI